MDYREIFGQDFSIQVTEKSFTKTYDCLVKISLRVKSQTVESYGLGKYNNSLLVDALLNNTIEKTTEDMAKKYFNIDYNDRFTYVNDLNEAINKLEKEQAATKGTVSDFASIIEEPPMGGSLVNFPPVNQTRTQCPPDIYELIDQTDKTGVLCNFCKWDLESITLDYCDRNLQGQHICRECQKDLKAGRQPQQKPFWEQPKRVQMLRRKNYKLGSKKQ